ncbi:MAG: DNA-directed RNA polymerase subunit alpha C-terminal domain-containing protein [Anaerolineae bacterium]|nr:DNA-directed RNA polymerase subunit alpha C-terminal domain-containing protein [Anaerolineae bacterium]
MEVNDFDAIRISLASPDQIREWSHGEVLKPETINYRTLRPERDGLFCERIFGPTKDWECYCGKYKRVRYKGIVCDKCGVEVAPSRVRRERMGHIELASPVSHIWYVKGVPSRLGLLLDISPRNLERVLYFAQYIITEVDEEARQRTIQRHERELAMRLARQDSEIDAKIAEIEIKRDEAIGALDAEERRALAELQRQLEQETGSVIAEAKSLTQRLENRLGKPSDEVIHPSWLAEPLLAKGEVITRSHVDRLNELTQDRLSEIDERIGAERAHISELIAARRDQQRREADKQILALQEHREAQAASLRQSLEQELLELKSLRERQLLTESRYRELAERWGNVFKAGMGAEAIRDIVARMDLDKMAKELRGEIKNTRSKQRRKKAAKQLRVVEAFRKSGNRPEWMILTVLPVIPPDLRPMVQLDGGRFATSDLNDLYRRVINRNNRLRRLLELGAPDVIVRNEKRMLQEAVDSLIDNGRRGRAVSRSGKRKLKSLSDMLKGKQGRFRRNLLGKRVDYSGRSVIVIGPQLKLHQCGLPKKMALELFKPFVMRRLVEHSYAHNIKSAKRMVDRSDPAVWDVLEDIIKERPVLLNRAPTLHRLGIQAFEVVLIEGNAIQLHPLACAAFNADFDGDQMAVHVPLSDMAVYEARNLMLSSRNLLKPASGEPIVGPSKDMVLGVYYMTTVVPGAKGEGKIFADFDEVVMAYELGHIDLRAKITTRFTSEFDHRGLEELGLSDRVLDALHKAGITTIGQVLDRLAHGPEGERKFIAEVSGFGPKALAELKDQLRRHGYSAARWPKSRIIETTAGRVIFNMGLPPNLHFVNEVMDKKTVNNLVAECYELLGEEQTAKTVDDIKDMGFRYATRSGFTIAVSDIQVPAVKTQIIEATTREVEQAERQYRRGLITEEEQYNRVVELWTRATDDITQAVKEQLDPLEGIGAMATSGATKGGVTPIRQLAGMRGLMADPSGRIIALPIRSNFREGLTALEYFLSTHGARKGLADTALRTADAGYLTRRLVDVAQDVIITEEDCGTEAGIWIDEASSKEIGEKLAERLLGRMAAAPIADPKTGEVLVERNEMIDEAALERLAQAGVKRAYVRSPLSCETRFGLCRMCYGRDLGRGKLVALGEAVGIIAAQSIGEPGTQLTLRTFHTGGVAGAEDITQGLPRVEELFEARTPKGEAVISEIDGVVDVYWQGEQRMIKVTNSRVVRRAHTVPAGAELVIQDGDRVQEDTVLARLADGREMLAGTDGTAFVDQLEDGSYSVVVRREEVDEWEQPIPPSARLKVDKGDRVRAGDQLTEGSKNPREVLRIQGREACQMYLLEEVQKVYRSQGVSIHDKHIEIIIRQMLRKVQIRTAGDGEVLPGELMDRFAFEEANARIIAAGGQPARADTVLLGVTKASLNTESFLAAASFQETTRVLTEAAVRGKRDHLRGLKENVIIGKLIPVGTGFEARKAQRTTEEMSEPVEQGYVADDLGEVEMEGDHMEDAFGMFPTFEELGDYDGYGDE